MSSPPDIGIELLEKGLRTQEEGRIVFAELRWGEKIEFVINLKTAKQLDITIPPTVLYQATKVIR